MLLDESKNYDLTSDYVIEEIMGLAYLLPKEEEFTEQMRTQKLAAMPVSTVPKPDIVTADKSAFLKFLKLSNVRGVMYAYAYYTPADLDRFYDLQDADKAFFVQREEGAPPATTRASFGGYYSKSYYSAINPQKVVSDYEQYLLYCKYMRLALDLTYPTRLEIYALCEGRLICCRLEDPWLERLKLPNAPKLKAQCVGTGTPQGTGGKIAFRFRYVPLVDQDAARAAAAARDGLPDEPDMPTVRTETALSEHDKLLNAAVEDVLEMRAAREQEMRCHRAKSPAPGRIRSAAAPAETDAESTGEAEPAGKGRGAARRKVEQVILEELGAAETASAPAPAAEPSPQTKPAPAKPRGGKKKKK